MTKNVIISAETGLERSLTNSNSDVKIIDLELDILDETICFRIFVRQIRARLADIVPLARKISTKINEIVIKNIQNNGQQIPCKKGCSACCKCCFVPISIPEAFILKDEVEQAPTNLQNSINRNCLIASRHLLTHKTTRKFIHQSGESLSNNPSHLNLISDWYSSLKLACPFLQQDICTIYEQRPLACREHYIIGTAGMCDRKDCNVEVLDMPIRVSDALGQLASELEETAIEAVILPLVFLWGDENKKRAERTWPFEMMVTRFVEIIEAMANKDSAIAV